MGARRSGRGDEQGVQSSVPTGENGLCGGGIGTNEDVEKSGVVLEVVWAGHRGGRGGGPRGGERVIKKGTE